MGQRLVPGSLHGAPLPIFTLSVSFPFPSKENMIGNDNGCFRSFPTSRTTSGMLHAAMRGTRSQADPGLQGIMVTHFAFWDAYPNQAPSGRCRRGRHGCHGPFNGTVGCGGAGRRRLPRHLRACLICRLWKAWPANQALASQSSVRKGQRPCLMFLHQLSLAEAFFLFDSECGAWPKGN
jgi:hypothetical protein